MSARAHASSGETVASGPAGPPAAEALAGRRILAVMPSIPLGGMERANVEILRSLARAGAEVAVLTQREHGGAVQRACEDAGCRCIPASLHCHVRFPRGPLELAGALYERLNFLAVVARAWLRTRPHRLYITNSSYFWYCWPLVWLARDRVVFRLPAPPSDRGGPIRRLMRRLAWRWVVVPSCAHVVCNSEHTLERLRRTGASTRRASVIHNLLPQRKATGVGDAPHMDPARRHVVYIGRITRAKGVAELVEAATRICELYPDVDFWIVGEHAWRNPFARELMCRVETAGLGERIRFPGEIEDVPALLGGSFAHVLFSYTEGFGLAVLEAKSQGVPSIVSRAGALPELVAHGVDGYVCASLDARSLAEGLRYFLDDRDARDRAGQAAYESLKRFPHDALTRRWVEIFRA